LLTNSFKPKLFSRTPQAFKHLFTASTPDHGIACGITLKGSYPMDEAQYLALVRHGESFANVEIAKASGGLYYAISGSDRDVGITPNGEWDCQRAGNILARLFPSSFPIARIWNSEFRRIWQSSDRIQRHLPYPVETVIDKRLNKRSYGRFWNLTYEGVRVLHEHEDSIYNALGPLKYRPPEGENFYDLFERVDRFMLTEINQSRGNQLVVGHSAVLLAMQRSLDGLDDMEVVRQYEEVSIPNGYVLLYRRERRDQPWKRVYIADYLRGERGTLPEVA
jgi:broad specificity phosphatase PhoE